MSARRRFSMGYNGSYPGKNEQHIPLSPTAMDEKILLPKTSPLCAASTPFIPAQTPRVIPRLTVPSPTFHSHHYEHYAVDLTNVQRNISTLFFTTFEGFPRTLEDWRALRFPFYINRSMAFANDVLNGINLEGRPPACSVSSMELQHVPSQHFPTLGIPTRPQIFPRLARAAYANAHSGNRDLVLEVSLADAASLPPSYQHIPAYTLRMPPAFAISSRSRITVKRAHFNFHLYIRENDCERLEGNYVVCGSLGFSLNNRYELLKLKNTSDSRIFHNIIILVDPTNLHPSVPLEIGPDAHFACEYLEKWMEWDDASPGDEKSSQLRLHSMVALLFQVMQVRRREG